MELSVIIRARNEGEILRDCLRQVFLQKVPPQTEFILIDEASRDRTPEIAREFPFNRILRLSEFHSGSRSLNQGCEESRGRTILHLLGHTIPQDPQTFQELLSGFKEEAVAAVYGRQLPHPLGDPFKNVDLRTGYGADGRETPFVSHSFAAVRRETWRRIPYDETYRSAEDKVWSLQARSSGMKLRYEPKAVVLHYHALGLGRVFRKAYRNARTHRRIGLSKRPLFFRLDQRVAADLRYLEKKRYVVLSPVYRGLQAAGYAAGWYLP